MSSRLVDRFCSVLQPGAVDLVSDTINRFRLGTAVRIRRTNVVGRLDRSVGVRQRRGPLHFET